MPHTTALAVSQSIKASALLPCSGHLSQLSHQQQQQHRLPLGHFQVRRMLTADDIQDDFDWDSIV